MTKRKFFTWLFGISISLLLIALLMHGRNEVGKFTDFSVYSIIGFTGLSILMYVLGVKAAQSDNKYSFNNLIVGNMLLKMILSVLIILVYKNAYNIDSRAFLLPFLIVYLSFTIFETYFLTKLAKS